MKIPRALSVAVVGLVSLGIGIGLARLGQRDVATRTGPGAPTSSEEHQAPLSASEEPEAPSLAEEASDAGVDVGVTPEPSTDPVRPSPPTALSSLRLTPGRVAYLRCDGLPPRSGTFPCPRDDALEREVWSIVSTLPECVRGPRSPGSGDLRLEYRGVSAPEVGWRDTFADDVVRLPRDSVLGCVRERIVATRQHLGSRRLIVSFRFALE